MNEFQAGIRIFTLDEAQDLLPQVRDYLGRLKGLRQHIVGLQARVDIEELTQAPSLRAPSARLGELLREIEREVHSFHKLSEELGALGCELKDLDKGLVDFYGLRGGEVVYYCWQEGEERISHWHPLDSGFQGRKEL